MGALTGFRSDRIFREKGGPVDSDEPYIVGEGGPEIFVPQKSGTIVPNNKVSSFIKRRINRGSLNPFGQTKISSGAAGRVRVPVFSGRPNQSTTMSSRGTRFATKNISTARSYTNPFLRGLPGTGGAVNPKGTLDTGTLPKRYIQKFGSRSILGQDQIKMGSRAYSRTFGRRMVQKSGQGMLNLLKLGKIAPFLGTALDFAFPEPLADGTLESAQRMNIPGTPVVRSNKAMDASSFNITEVANQLQRQLDDQNSETNNETFSIDLPLGDPKVYEIYGADIGL